MRSWRLALQPESDDSNGMCEDFSVSRKQQIYWCPYMFYLHCPLALLVIIAKAFKMQDLKEIKTSEGLMRESYGVRLMFKAGIRTE